MQKDFVYVFHGPCREIPWEKIKYALGARSNAEAVLSVTINCETVALSVGRLATLYAMPSDGDEKSRSTRQNGACAGDRPTMRDVAREARVSGSTVSRYLRNDQCVSAGVAKRIRAAVDRLGYQLNESASNIAQRKRCRREDDLEVNDPSPATMYSSTALITP